MHIDFASPSNGIYNNAGSCRQLINYMEHEDLERIEKGIYTEGFFNLTEDNIYKSTVIKDIDTNIGQLLKTDAKFYAIHVSPSESELRAMGNILAKRKRMYFNPVKKKTIILAVLIVNKKVNSLLIWVIVLAEILCYLFFHWQMAVATTQHW